MALGNRKRSQFKRRRVLEVGGLGGIVAIAGCLGDDEVDPDDGDDAAADDDVGDIDDTDDVDEVDDHDDIADDEPGTEGYDVMSVWTNNAGARPADAQYNAWADGPLPPFMEGNKYSYDLINRGRADEQYYGVIADGWDYEPGLVEISIHDDFYWWSGDQVTIDDYLMGLELSDFVHGGDDLDATDDIVRYEKVDDDTARLALVDSWHESFAMTRLPFGVGQSREFLEPWLEEFRDAGDLDMIDELREDLSDDYVTSDDRLVHHHNTPFEFRIDGDLGELHETEYIMELVPEKNGNKRHYVDEINFTRLGWPAVEEHDIRRVEDFMNQDQPHIGVGAIEDPDTLDFDTELVGGWARDVEPFGFTFNHDRHPTDNVHFRRAWAYLTDRTLWNAEINHVAPEHFHPFLSDTRAEQYIGADIIDSFTDYGWDEIRPDAAEAEMLAGGFERNGDGNWLMKTDGSEAEAGEPIEFIVDSFDFLPQIGEVASDFWIEANEFGLDVELLIDEIEDWTISAKYSGGEIPEVAFDSTFGSEDLTWAAPNPNFPSTVEAPPVGDTTEPGDEVELEEFETRPMSQRLPVTTEESQYQALLDSLAWCANQLLPRYTVRFSAQMYRVNDHRWSFHDPEERPDKYVQKVTRMSHLNGQHWYVPEEER